VAEVEDAGYSGASLERPGLDQVRDLVRNGDIDFVLAQDADRITRDAYHRGFLDDEFARHETLLVALDDWGDDSHQGKLLKFIKGWQSEGERLKIVERSRRGKLQKVREGKMVADGKANYGFAYTPDKDTYVVNEAEMEIVRHIFAEIARGSSLNSLVEELLARGIRSPSGATKWSHSQLRNMVLRMDVYLPHERKDLA
jgi:site-specific DNA recombinase